MNEEKKKKEEKLKQQAPRYTLKPTSYVGIKQKWSKLDREPTNRYDLGYDSELERILLRRRREARCARQAELEQQLNMAAEHNDDNFNNVENQNRITLGQYINPTADSCGSTIRRPAIQANNFELKPS
ncbi:hypothetical protein PIB30_027705 [Stylosanthes scabra]|uniref:Uncharacterized protein n=1 Tax=Stylosanthes scabra TaxID=79078 RepID=A0ABU6VCC6_9FABA|nr:hypothetical protein [Stylosanthes scabra]